MKPYTLVPFTADDVAVLTPVMKRAFDAESQFHRGCDGGPPGYDDGSFLRQWALHPHATALRIEVEGQAVGAVILWLNQWTKINTLGCIFLAPEMQKNGIGTAIWQELEQRYPAREWRVETPVFARMNHHFYVNKCGFELYRISQPKSPYDASCQMRKRYDKRLSPFIERKEAFQVLAMSRVFTSENCMTEIPKFWSWFFENGYQKIVCGMFGICHHAVPDGKSFTYSIAAPYDGAMPVPEGFEVLTIAAHTWAIFDCVGPMPQAIQQMWPRIYSEWLPGSGYEKVNDFDIELYSMGDLQSPDYESFILIPVERRVEK